MSQLDELRHIIVGDNSEKLAELKNRIEDVEKRTHDVAEVLSPAIEKEVASSDSALINSLQKPVSLGLKRAIRSEPQEYAEILYPVMAPSIRRAIAQAISSMMVTINRTIESATTVQGLSLRYQSVRTGIPYAELAFRNTLLYRVEHLYLIHRETGMAISSVHADNTESLDSDAVGAMFSAIQSFVQDSFSGDESSRLTDLKVGEQNVWVAHGPNAMLACVIRGDAPESLKAQLYDTLDSIRTQYANAIADFEGDNAEFVDVDTVLNPLLQSQIKDYKDDDAGVNQGESTSKPPSLLMKLVYAVLGFLLLYFIVQWGIGKSKIDTLKHFLEQTPGVSVTDVLWTDGQLQVNGFKDPDAIIPFDTLSAYDIKRDDLLFKTVPFRSLETAMEFQRFNNDFDIPKDVTLAVNDGLIEMSGSAPLKWLHTNGDRILQLTFDRRLSIANLSVNEASVLAYVRDILPFHDLSNLKITTVPAFNNPKLKKKVVVEGVTDFKSLQALTIALAGSPWVDFDVGVN